MISCPFKNPANRHANNLYLIEASPREIEKFELDLKLE